MRPRAPAEPRRHEVTIVVAALAAMSLGGCAPRVEPAAVGIEAPVEASIALPEEEERPVVETRRIDPTQPATAYLDGSHSHARMAKLAFVGPLFGAEPAEGAVPLTGRQERAEASFPRRLVVVEERAASVRTVIESNGVRLVAYVLHEDLHPVVRRRTRVSVGVRKKAVDAGPDGIWVRPGVEVEAQEHGGLRAVVIDDPLFHGEGWVDAVAVDRVYEPDLPQAIAEHKSAVDGVVTSHIVGDQPASSALAPTYLQRGTTIVTAGGEALVEIAAALLAVEELAREGDRLRVRYVSSTLWVEGWVPLGAVEENVGLGYGTGHGRGFRFLSGGRHRILHAGDRLYDPASGEAVGVVTARRRRAGDLGRRGDGWLVRLAVDAWRPVLGISQADAERGERWERIYHDRARIMPEGGADLPWQIGIARPEVAACWDAAMARGADRALRLPLVWKEPRRAVVVRAFGAEARLVTCLQEAFAELGDDEAAPSLPRRFTIILEPLPLPERPQVPSSAP